jgi:hypothetical protein
MKLLLSFVLFADCFMHMKEWAESEATVEQRFAVIAGVIPTLIRKSSLLLHISRQAGKRT